MSKKILIVEDETDLIKLLKHNLEKEGFKVNYATDGSVALAEVRRDPPDLVILDLMLPAGGGLKVLKNIRSNLKTMILPVIVVSAVKDTKYEQEIQREGVQAYFEKPYDFDELLSTIKSLLQKGES